MNLQEIPGWAVASSPSERSSVAHSLGFSSETEFSEVQNDFCQMYGNVRRFHAAIEKSKQRIELKEQLRERELLTLEQQKQEYEEAHLKIEERSESLDRREEELRQISEQLREREKELRQHEEIFAIREQKLLAREESLREIEYFCSFPSCSNFSTGNANTLIYLSCGHLLCQNCILSRKECMKCKFEKTKN